MNQNILNQTILTYDDLIQQEEGAVDEKLVDVTSYNKDSVAEYIKEDMLPITGPTIFVRETLAKHLAAVQTSLTPLGYRLKIAYGYRHPKIQEKYFNNRKDELRIQHPNLSEQALDRLTHNFVADPRVAGHPAAAAVDLTLVHSDETTVDMGTEIADYANAEKIITFATGLTDKQKANRKILHDAMVAKGFAPFYGEWWHFSYGDREWAAFYNKKALYAAVAFRFKTSTI